MLVKKMLAGANEDAGKKRCWQEQMKMLVKKMLAGANKDAG